MVRGKQTGTRRQRRLLLLARDFRGKQQTACVDGGKTPGSAKAKKQIYRTSSFILQAAGSRIRSQNGAASCAPHRSQQPGRLHVWLIASQCAWRPGLPKRGGKTTRPNRAAAI